jgi:endonuclease G
MMSNMTPQHCAFNRGTWLILEKLVRHWATEKGEIYIIGGAVFDRDGTPGRDSDDHALRMVSRTQAERVAVPSHFYKILLHEQSDGSIETISFLLPHVAAKLPASENSRRQHFLNNIVSINDIEEVTGNRFLVDLEQSDPTGAQSVKAFTASSLWPEPTSWPSRLDSGC